VIRVDLLCERAPCGAPCLPMKAVSRSSARSRKDGDVHVTCGVSPPCGVCWPGMEPPVNHLEEPGRHVRCAVARERYVPSGYLAWGVAVAATRRWYRAHRGVQVRRVEAANRHQASGPERPVGSLDMSAYRKTKFTVSHPLFLCQIPPIVEL